MEADVSLISQNDLTKGIVIVKCKGNFRIKSASGNQINIVRKACGIE